MLRLRKVSSSFVEHCIRYYNKIPKILQNLSKNKFKAHFKNVQIRKAYYTVNDYIDDTIAGVLPANKC